MGKIQSQIQDETKFCKNLTENLNIDLNRKVMPELHPLCDWNLSEVRSSYEKYRTLSSVPFIDRITFTHIVPFNFKYAQHIYDVYSRKKQYINVYEFLSCLILTAYSTYTFKIHLLYLLFDLDCSNSIELDELIVIFICTLRGYCKLTKTKCPPYTTVEKYAKLMFLNSDIETDNALILREIIDWIEGNKQVIGLFKRFDIISQTEVARKEEVTTLLPFKGYSSEEAEMILQIIRDSSKSKKYYRQLTFELNQVKIKSITAVTKNLLPVKEGIFSLMKNKEADLEKKQRKMEKKQHHLHKLYNALDTKQLQFERRINKEHNQLDNILDSHQMRHDQNFAATQQDVQAFILQKEKRSNYRIPLSRQFTKQYGYFNKPEDEHSQPNSTIKGLAKKPTISAFQGQKSIKSQQNDDMKINKNSKDLLTEEDETIQHSKSQILNISQISAIPSLKQQQNLQNKDQTQKQRLQEDEQIQCNKQHNQLYLSKKPSRIELLALTQFERNKFIQSFSSKMDKQQQSQLMLPDIKESKERTEQLHNMHFVNQKNSNYKSDLRIFNKLINGSQSLVDLPNSKFVKAPSILTRRNEQRFGEEEQTWQMSNNEFIEKRKEIQKNFSSHSNNVLIIQGNTITKHDIWNLKGYFDKLSLNKEKLTKEDFASQFENKKHMLQSVQPLYQYLDSSQTGEITFETFLYKFYTHLQPDHIKTIKKWLFSYDQTYKAEQSLNALNLKREEKKKLVPKACLPAIKEMFDNFDRGNKGFLDYADLKTGFKQFEMVDLEKFHKKYADSNGHINMHTFMRWIIPSDYNI